MTRYRVTQSVWGPSVWLPLEILMQLNDTYVRQFSTIKQLSFVGEKAFL